MRLGKSPVVFRAISLGLVSSIFRCSWLFACEEFFVWPGCQRGSDKVGKKTRTIRSVTERDLRRVRFRWAVLCLAPLRMFGGG